jgi:hypothetical protein
MSAGYEQVATERFLQSLIDIANQEPIVSYEPIRLPGHLAKQIGSEAMREAGFRVSVIDGDEVELQLLEDGRTHYRAVQVTGKPRSSTVTNPASS